MSDGMCATKVKTLHVVTGPNRRVSIKPVMRTMNEGTGLEVPHMELVVSGGVRSLPLRLTPKNARELATWLVEEYAPWAAANHGRGTL